VYLLKFENFDVFVTSKFRCARQKGKVVFMDEQKGRSGIFYTADGKMEVWFHGVCHGNVLPEELIDAELSALQKENDGGKRNGDYLSRR
jgi:hypothetical protein